MVVLHVGREDRANTRSTRSHGTGSVAPCSGLVGSSSLFALGAAFAVVPDDAMAQDSLAPEGALPHWIPNDDWVYEHWLPYDETRLYRLLGTDRGGIWRYLRDDAVHDLAQLAHRRGMSAGRAGRPARRAAQGPGVRGAVQAAAGARLPDRHPGPPLAAHPLPLAAPADDPAPRAVDLRRLARALPRPARRGAQPARHRADERPQRRVDAPRLGRGAAAHRRPTPCAAAR